MKSISKNKKYIWVIIIALLVIGGATTYYFFNKGPVNIKNASATKVSAVELYQTFLSDTVAARQQYADKVLQVSGTLVQSSKNLQNQAIVMLQTNEMGAYINCTMEEEPAGLLPDSKVTIKGICTGMGMGDVDLGILGDVYLTRCYLMK